MRVTITPVLFNDREDATKWAVKVSQGVQSFTMGFESYKKKDVVWMAKMFRVALKKHDEETTLRNFRKALRDSSVGRASGR